MYSALRNIPRPQSVRSNSDSLVQAVRNLVEVFIEQSKMALAQRMHASGESADTIAATLGVSRATVYRALADDVGEGP